MRVIRQRQPPSGLSRLLFRLPIQFYRVGLGRLLGGRFLLLEHVGRRTGLVRRAVVEVVATDPGTGAWIIAAGFGPKTDWYRNLLANPRAHITVGGRRMAVTAIRVPPDEGGAVMRDYARRHSGAARKLCRFLGYEVDGSEADYVEVGRALLFVRLTPD